MRRILLSITAGVLTIGGLTLVVPSAARADDPPNMQDYNTYWAEVQAKQQWQDRQQPPQ